MHLKANTFVCIALLWGNVFSALHRIKNSYWSVVWGKHGKHWPQLKAISGLFTQNHPLLTTTITNNHKQIGIKINTQVTRYSSLIIMIIIVIIIISTTILIAKSSVQFSTFRGSLPHSVAQTHFLENKAFGHRNTFSHVICLLISVLVYEIQKSICRPCFLAEEKRKQIFSKIEGHHMFQTLLIPLPALDTIKP